MQRLSADSLQFIRRRKATLISFRFFLSRAPLAFAAHLSECRRLALHNNHNNNNNNNNKRQVNNLRRPQLLSLSLSLCAIVLRKGRTTKEGAEPSLAKKQRFAVTLAPLETGRVEKLPLRQPNYLAAAAAVASMRLPVLISMELDLSRGEFMSQVNARGGKSGQSKALECSLRHNNYHSPAHFQVH